MLHRRPCRAGREDRPNVRRRLAASDRPTSASRSSARALLARLSPRPADARGAASADRTGPRQRRKNQRRARRDRGERQSVMAERTGAVDAAHRGRARGRQAPRGTGSPASDVTAEQIMAKAREAAEQEHARMLAELRRDVGRLVVQTTGRRRQGAHAGRSAPARRGNRQASGGSRGRRMKTDREIQREAQRLFRLCLVDGSLDEARVRRSWSRSSRPAAPGGLEVLSRFQRLVRLRREAHSAKVESARPSPTMCGPDRSRPGADVRPRRADAYTSNPTLLGGVRITVGSDVYDGSVHGRLAALEDVSDSRVGSWPT